MTEPSQYFKGRTVQEQMNEVIGYVDVRAEEVAAAKADDVLEPAEQAKTDAIAAKKAAEDAQEAAEDARDATIAALPAVNQRIDGVVSDLNAVTLRVTTAEGDIVTIQGRVTAVENKNTQQDSAIAGLVAADANNVKINDVNQYAVGLTGNQEDIAGDKGFINPIKGRLVYPLYENYSGAIPSGKYRNFARIPADKPNTMIVLDALVSANGGNYGYGRILIGNPTSTGWFCKWAIRKSAGFLAANAIQIAKDSTTGDLLIFALNPTYTALSIQLVYSKYSSSVGEDVRVEKVTNTTYYSLDGTDEGIDTIIAGSDMS